MGGSPPSEIFCGGIDCSSEPKALRAVSLSWLVATAYVVVVSSWDLVHSLWDLLSAAGSCTLLPFLFLREDGNHREFQTPTEASGVFECCPFSKPVIGSRPVLSFAQATRSGSWNRRHHHAQLRGLTARYAVRAARVRSWWRSRRMFKPTRVCGDGQLPEGACSSHCRALRSISCQLMKREAKAKAHKFSPDRYSICDSNR